MSAPAMNVEQLVAIDVHAHVHSSVHDRPGEHPTDALFEYFGSEIVHPTVPDLAEYYRERHMACVAFMVDASAATREPVRPVARMPIVRQKLNLVTARRPHVHQDALEKGRGNSLAPTRMSNTLRFASP